MRADREAFIQQWSTQLSQDLVTARNNLDAARAQFEKAAKLEDLVRLTAPEASIVLTVAKVSVGSVLKSGDPFMTLMPANTPVEAEVRILSRDIGLPSSRAIDACSRSMRLTIPRTARPKGPCAGSARVRSPLDDDGKPVEAAYYKVRCSVDATHFTGVPANFQLIPGMTLAADINVGTRSVAMYLMDGVLRGFSEAMREP